MTSAAFRGGAALAWLGAFGLACSSAAVTASGEPPGKPPADSPLVALQPGAWFDAYGSVSVVGAGRRLRLVLSAPVLPCPPAFQGGGAPQDIAARASLPFQVLSDACRNAHPTILLAEESETASPTELERSYHEVAHCAAADWGLTDGWIPNVVAGSDPCPLALGLGWRLPHAEELRGLTLDDRKALAGALFDTEDRTSFGGLVLYARDADGALSLATLSPNAAEQAPVLSDDKRAVPFVGAALRCVRDSAASAPRATPPVLPHAAACLREQRTAQGLGGVQPSSAPAPELQTLRAWLDLVQHAPALMRNETQLRDLSQLLASPAIEQIARESREERALTERYAELADGLDDPAASPGERERRRAEFDQLRKRLGGQIVHKAQASGTDRTQLAALLSRLQGMLETATIKGKSAKKVHVPDYTALLSRVRELRSGKATAP